MKRIKLSTLEVNFLKVCHVTRAIGDAVNFLCAKRHLGNFVDRGVWLYGETVYPYETDTAAHRVPVDVVAIVVVNP